MIILSECFHWIGFHIAQHFLEAGEEVIGLDQFETKKEENLAMFFGRNSNFKHLEKQEEIMDSIEKARAVIHLGQTDMLVQEWKDLKTEKLFHLTASEVDPNVQDWRFIYLPLLFGEWMPRSDTGIYYQEEHVLFDSDVFQSDAVYAGDFARALRDFLNRKTTNQCKQTAFISERKKEKEIQSEKGFFKVKEEMPIEKRVKLLNEHYEQYSFFYNLL